MTYDDPVPAVGPGSLVCSARGCQEPAAWSLLWNNPKLHTPDRRKSWLACEVHRGTLGEFLSARGFLRSVEALPDSEADEPRE
jgi:hypothetical protein